MTTSSTNPPPGQKGGSVRPPKGVQVGAWNRGNRAIAYIDDDGNRVELTNEHKANLVRRLLNGETVATLAEELNRSTAWVFHLYREFGYISERHQHYVNLVHLTAASPDVQWRYQADLEREDAFPSPLDGITHGKPMPFAYQDPVNTRVQNQEMDAMTQVLPVETEINPNNPEEYVEFIRSLDPEPDELPQITPVPAPEPQPADTYIPEEEIVTDEIEQVDDVEDVEGQLREARQLQEQGMLLLRQQADKINEYKELLGIQDREITDLKAALSQLTIDHDRLTEAYRKSQERAIQDHQDAEHWRAHRHAESRRKEIEGSKLLKEGNRQYRQLLDSLRDKG